MAACPALSNTSDFAGRREVHRETAEHLRPQRQDCAVFLAGKDRPGDLFGRKVDHHCEIGVITFKGAQDALPANHDTAMAFEETAYALRILGKMRLIALAKTGGDDNGGGHGSSSRLALPRQWAIRKE